MDNYYTVRRFEDQTPPTGGYLNTYTGKKFEYTYPQPEQIDIRDIAHALSHLCRFNGHTNMFYSVAQHSLLVSEKLPGSAEDKLGALLHDAAEAYVCDIPSPLKPMLGVPYLHVYALAQGAILDKFQIGTLPDHLTLYDKAACVFEAEGVFGFNADELEERGFDPSVRELWTPWTPHQWAAENCDEEPGMIAAHFLLVFENLMKATGRNPS
jgi:hypothetical protein